MTVKRLSPQQIINMRRAQRNAQANDNKYTYSTNGVIDIAKTPNITNSRKKIAKPFPKWMTRDYLWDILDYNPETGFLHWKYNPDKPKEWNTRWVGKIAGKPDKAGYVRIRINFDHTYAAHRLAFYMMTGMQPPEVDHEDLNRSNNRFKNLRAADEHKNQHNRPVSKNNILGHKGISWKADNGFYYRICVNYKTYRKGGFKTAEAAAAEYAIMAKKLHKEFARAA